MPETPQTCAILVLMRLDFLSPIACTMRLLENVNNQETKMKNPIHTSLRAVAMATLLLGAAAAQAQDKAVELKFAHWLPASHPLAKLGFEPDLAGPHLGHPQRAAAQ